MAWGSPLVTESCPLPEAKNKTVGRHWLPNEKRRGALQSPRGVGWHRRLRNLCHVASGGRCPPYSNTILPACHLSNWIRSLSKWIQLSYSVMYTEFYLDLTMHMFLVSNQRVRSHIISDHFFYSMRHQCCNPCENNEHTYSSSSKRKNQVIKRRA